MAYQRKVEAKTNVARSYRYAIEMNGFDFGLAQSVKIGDEELSELEIGNGDETFVVPGKKKPQPVDIESMVAEETSTNQFTQYLLAVQKGVITDQVITFTIKLYGADGNIVRQWQVIQGWVQKKEIPTIGDNEDSIYIEKIRFHNKRVIPII